MRSAEKTRISTSHFADRIANLSIQRYREITPIDIQTSIKQTVLASIILRVEYHEKVTCHAVAIGVGTKYLCQQQINNIFSDTSEEYSSQLIDCHAEVLARRAFQRYLYTEILHYYKSPAQVFSYDELTDNSSITGIFESCSDESNLLQLKNGITVHLYTSSAPCGNACIRKWAKSKKEIFRQDLNCNEYILPSHSRIHITARDEGQVKVCVKPDSSRSLIDVNTISNNISNINTSNSDIISSTAEEFNSTISNNNDQGILMSCSDKVAKWNCLGIQGAQLCEYLSTPIYLSCIIIGRKFSRVHCERALCCRLQDYISSHSSTTFRIHHPSIHCSAIKFDESILNTNILQQTDFTNHLCLHWSFAHEVEIIDGSTGFKVTNKKEEDLLENVHSYISCISSYSLHKYHEDITKELIVDIDNNSKCTTSTDSVVPGSINLLQQEYQEAKNVLFNDEKCFRDWVRGLKRNKHQKEDIIS